MIIDFITWNVNPEIFSIGPISVRYYGLLFASSFIFGYIIMKNIFVKDGLSIEMLDKLSLYMFVGTVVGARLGHVIFYQPDYYLEHPLEILEIWKGGLASHGATVGIIIALILVSKKINRTFLWTVDRIVIVVALAGFLIRTGNLMNSEIYGIATNLPWGFIFERNNEIIAKHPTQIYEGAIALILFFVLYYSYFKTNIFKKPGLAFGIFLITIFTDRFIIEFVKEAQVNFEENWILNMGQILSIPAIITGIAFIILSFKNKNKELYSK